MSGIDCDKCGDEDCICRNAGVAEGIAEGRRLEREAVRGVLNGWRRACRGDEDHALFRAAMAMENELEIWERGERVAAEKNTDR